jgi:hypothetical protein
MRAIGLIKVPTEVVVILLGCFALALGSFVKLVLGALSVVDGELLLTITNHATTGVTVYVLWPR